MSELSAPAESTETTTPQLTRAEMRKQRGRSKKASDPNDAASVAAASGHHRGRVVVVLAVCLFLVAAVLAAWAGTRLSRTAPPATVSADVAATVRAPGTPPAMPWPTMGQAAVSIPAVGYSAQSGVEKPVPVASLTKIMTGYIVLHDHPLPALPTTKGAPMPADADGPPITITAADVNIFETDATSDQSNVEVHVGEVLSERQLIDGTLIRSANNLATALALWDAGSIPAFVAKMNATAQSLGMTNTHYVDASGFDQASVSTAADVLKVAAVAMQEPGFSQTVDNTQVTLPYVGTLDSYTPLIGVDGAVGVKSGYTSQAGGCDVLAMVRQIDGTPVTVLASSTGQIRAAAIATAGVFALGLATAASKGVEPVVAVATGQTVGTVNDGHATAPIAALHSVRVLAWPSQTVTVRLAPSASLRAGARAGSSAGALLVSVGTQTVTDPVATVRGLPGLTLSQRLF